MSLRSMCKVNGTFDAPRSTIQTKREVVTVGNRTMIITTFTTPYTIHIYIGNRTIYCMDIQLGKSADNVVSPMGTINKIRWDNTCSLDHEFGHGSDTERLFQLAMTYLRDHYAAVEHVEFMDTSSKRCDNGASVSLAGMKLFTGGRTWYANHFQAVVSPSHQTAYQTMMDKSNAIKQEMSWAQFQQHAPCHLMDNMKMDELERLYEASSTWQDFFSGVRDRIGISGLCIWFSKKGWFDAFLHHLRFHLISIPFLVQPHQFRIEYTITDTTTTDQAGGKRRQKYTRKDPRPRKGLKDPRGSVSVSHQDVSESTPRTLF